MVHAGLSPGVAPRSRPLWLLPPACLGVALFIALLLVSPELRWAVAWSGAVSVALSAVATAVAVRRARSAAAAGMRQQFEGREAVLQGQLADQRGITVWLAEELLPAAVARLRKGEPAAEISQSVVLGAHLDEAFAAASQTILGRLLEAVQAEEHAKDSSRRALVAVARRVQAIVHQATNDLQEMQVSHGRNLALSKELQHIEHRTALVGRIAASIAVLGDGRPGRQWNKAIPLYDILRGAMGRIVDYPRVRLQSVTDVAVVGPSAEPLIHLLAELLDNATGFSPPKTPVEVSASEVPSGVAIEIEDRGVGLNDEVRRRIDEVMAHASLSELGEFTQLGLPVVSKVARENGFQVDLRTSAYGGVRAVVLVPRSLITTVAPAARTRAGAPRVPRQSMSDKPAVRPAIVGGTTAHGLPQRQRVSEAPPPIVRTSRQLSSAGGGDEAAPTSREPGRMFEGFGGHRTTAAPTTTSSEPTDEGE
jgi:signal transduction histidine kinase